MVMFTFGVVSSDVSATTWGNSNITDNFGVWMFTIKFLFFKFNLEINVGDVFSSSNYSVTSVISLTLGMDNWNSIEVFWESNTYEIFHDVGDGSND
jgi:hypothetical protein